MTSVAPATLTPQARAYESMRTQGLRITSQRKTITEVAFANREHFTAESLLTKSRKKDSQVSRATVYRTLSFLVRAGLLRQVGLGQSSSMIPILRIIPGTDTSSVWIAKKLSSFTITAWMYANRLSRRTTASAQNA